MGFSDTLKELLDQGLSTSKELAAKTGEKAVDLGAKGLEASKGFAAKAGEKAADLGSKGLEASKGVAVKAGTKLQELGQKGSLMLEIKQLEGRTKKLIALLGVEVYEFMGQSAGAAAAAGNAESAGDAEAPAEGEGAADGNPWGFPPEIRTIYDQLISIKETIERKETELKNIGAKGK